MTSVDFSSLVQPLVEIAGAAIAAFAAVLAQKAIAAFEARTKVQLTDQQKATVMGAVQTAAGMVKLEMSKGTIALSDVHIANPTVAEIAKIATAGVQESIAALGVTPEGVAKMVVGKVGNDGGAVIATPLLPYSEGLSDIAATAATLRPPIPLLTPFSIGKPKS